MPLRPEYLRRLLALEAERDRYKGALERIRDCGCDLEKTIGLKCAPMYPCRGCIAAEALAAAQPGERG